LAIVARQAVLAQGDQKPANHDAADDEGESHVASFLEAPASFIQVIGEHLISQTVAAL
jgi:hypothetical protein